MSRTKNKYSICIVKNASARVVGYLSRKDEKNGKDIQLDLKGYKVIAL